jgi:sulfate-transporting ATPase
MRSSRGLAEVSRRKKKLDEVYAAYAEPDADFDSSRRSRRGSKRSSPPATGNSTEVRWKSPPDALRLPPWDASIAKLSGGEKRRVAPVPAAAVEARHAAARRADQPPRRESVDWLEQFLAKFPGTVVAVTHDRYFLDNAAEWILELDRGSGIPWKGNYSSWLEQKNTRLKQENRPSRRGRRRSRKELEWVRQNPKGRQAKSKARLRASRNCLAGIPEAQRDAGDLHPGRRAAGRFGDRVQERVEGLRRPAADRRPVVQDSARARSSASSVRTAPASRRCSG